MARSNGFFGLILAVAGFVGFAGNARVEAARTATSTDIDFTAHIVYDQPRSYYEAQVNLAESERARIQSHLASVETDMRKNPPRGLTAAQLQNRLALLDTLHEYQVGGVFPQNRDFPDRLIPYFIDAAGVPCAMGKLVIASGYGDFAEEIRVLRNNAYIAEIAAADGRLAAWGIEQGITLEEAARIQPAYGPPRTTLIFQVRTDSLFRPWTLGMDNNVVGGVALFYRDSAQWKLFGGDNLGATFCLTASGRPMIVGINGSSWNGRNYTTTPYASACAWSPHDSDAWVGTRQGLMRMRRTGSMDILTRTRFSTPLASDTVTGVTTTGDAVWGATGRGLYRRGLQGVDTLVTMWDSAALGGNKVTGLKAGGGKRVWVGIEGLSNGATGQTFSTRGLRRYDGSTWTPYISAMSSVFVPSDTIYALALRDTNSVWIAVRAGFYRFAGHAGPTQKVADIPAGVQIFDMVGNAQGFYAGTSNGLYEFRNDSLVSLGVPAVSIRTGGQALRPGSAPPRLRALLKSQVADEATRRTLLGRKTEGSQGSRTAAGIYLSSPPEKP